MVQPSDADAIFRLAKNLAESSSDEHCLRSAVSRAYYAVFLLAREKMKVTSDHNVHAEVIRRVRMKGNVIADSLYSLKEYRVSADYDFPCRSDHSDWAKNWQFVEIKATHLLARIKTW